MMGDHWSVTVASPPSLQARHRFLQHLLIEFDADFADMAGLLLAQKIAGAANIHVMAGDGETGAQLVQRLQHFQPPRRGFGQLLVGGRGQIGIGALLGAADAAAQLVELRQAEHVGALDDQGVGGGNVQAGFHDIGGDQHIHLANSVFARSGSLTV